MSLILFVPLLLESLLFACWLSLEFPFKSSDVLGREQDSWALSQDDLLWPNSKSNLTLHSYTYT